MPRGLTEHQIKQFYDDGFLIVRDVLPIEARQPLISELNDKVDHLANQAVQKGLVAPERTFPDAPFETRLNLVCHAATDRNWILARDPKWKV